MTRKHFAFCAKSYIGPGDCCIIEVGQYHSIENNSDSDVEFMALIYNEPGYLNDRD